MGDTYIGPGFLSLLGLLFITLKLLGKIDWSWVLVLLPIWGPLALFRVILVIMLFALGVLYLVAAILGV